MAKTRGWGTDMSDTAIKSMKLYSQVDRVFNDLRAAGIAGDAPLSVELLSRFDQYHYYGTDAVDEAVERAGITAASKVLDVGSGIGGPARYLADTTGCSVTAIELQADLNDVASQLTARCGLGERIAHRCADILAAPLPKDHFDAVVSWLCFYHIPDRRGLLAQCFATLRPGGVLYVEDLFALGEFTADQQALLAHMLFANYLPSPATYRADLEAAGFQDIAFEDVTGHWAPFVAGRLQNYLAERAKNVATHGQAVVDDMETFYRAVNDLFKGGSLGGARVVARKPL